MHYNQYNVVYVIFLPWIFMNELSSLSHGTKTFITVCPLFLNQSTASCIPLQENTCPLPCLFIRKESTATIKCCCMYCVVFFANNSFTDYNSTQFGSFKKLGQQCKGSSQGCVTKFVYIIDVWASQTY